MCVYIYIYIHIHMLMHINVNGRLARCRGGAKVQTRKLEIRSLSQRLLKRRGWFFLVVLPSQRLLKRRGYILSAVFSDF